MNKEHKKMYKAGKSWVTAMVTIAAVALFTNATTSVHADTVVNNTNNAATTEKVEDTQSYTEAARQSTTANTDSNQNTANTNANSNMSTDSSSNTQPQVASNGNQWTHFNGGWSYTDNQGNWVYNQWQRINNNWYYFNNGGYAQTGWFRSGAGNWYYFDNNNAWADTGWQYINNNWYYFDKDNAWALTGWQKLNNKWYYFDNNNAWALRGWQHINNSWYYFDWNNAWALTDWQRINNNWYYFDDNNAWALTGWHKLNNKWYYFDYNNAWALKGWQRINNSWYYFDWNNAWALTGWQKLNNKWYYFDPNNAWMLTGSQYINGATEYFLPSGEWDKWHFVKEAQTKLDNDQTKLNNAGTDVPGNGDDSSQAGPNNPEYQFNHRSKAEFQSGLDHWFHENNQENAVYLKDDDKIPATHTVTSLTDPDGYETDMSLRHVYVKSQLNSGVLNKDQAAIDYNLSANLTNYALELINQLRTQRGLAPLTTNSALIRNAIQALPNAHVTVQNWGGMNVNVAPNLSGYGITNYYFGDTVVNGQATNAFSKGAYAPMPVDSPAGWMSIDNFHRSVYTYLKDAIRDNNPIVNELIYAQNPQAIAIQFQGSDMYLFTGNPVTQSSANTTAL